MASATRVSSGPERATKTTRAPLAASCSASARPSPRPAPVTKADLPLRSMMAPFIVEHEAALTGYWRLCQSIGRMPTHERGAIEPAGPQYSSAAPDARLHAAANGQIVRPAARHLVEPRIR